MGKMEIPGIIPPIYCWRDRSAIYLVGRLVYDVSGWVRGAHFGKRGLVVGLALRLEKY